MSDYTFLLIGLSVLVWVAIGSSTLDFGTMVDNEPLTSRDVIAAFTIEPLLIVAGLTVFGLIFLWCQTPLSIQRRLKKRVAV